MVKDCIDLGRIRADKIGVAGLEIPIAAISVVYSISVWSYGEGSRRTERRVPVDIELRRSRAYAILSRGQQMQPTDLDERRVVPFELRSRRILSQLHHPYHGSRSRTWYRLRSYNRWLLRSQMEPNILPSRVAGQRFQ